ncbi:unnamed protein product [Lathyrus oleraceus]
MTAASLRIDLSESSPSQTLSYTHLHFIFFYFQFNYHQSPKNACFSLNQCKLIFRVFTLRVLLLSGNMNHFDNDEVPILSIARAQRSDEPDISSVRRNILRTRSASISKILFIW